MGVTLDDLKPRTDVYPFEIDDRFKDKVICPGFIEAHTHPVMVALAISRPSLSYFPMRNPYGAEIPAVKTRDEALCQIGWRKSSVGSSADRDVWSRKAEG